MSKNSQDPNRKRPVQSTAGVELVRLLAAEGGRVFTTARARELAGGAGLSQGYLRQALHHLVRSGWLVRLRKGLYALASSVPGVTPAHELEIAMALVDPAAISHWSALHHHGFTDQVPREVFVLTTTEAAVPRARGAGAKAGHSGYSAGGHVFRFVRVQPERYFGTQRVWIGETRVSITDPERTLLDGLSRPQYCGDFAEVLHAFEVAAPELDVEKIVEYALRLDAATAKRLGWVLERQQVPRARLERLETLPIKGPRTLDPTGPRQGPLDRRWRIRENLPGRLEA
jgi:predicted transcriptional regulator of viral defense system